MAIFKNGQQISSYRFSEVSELSEGVCYVAEGDLYGYLNSDGKLLTPYQFAIASNFKKGFALVGDSLYQNIPFQEQFLYFERKVRISQQYCFYRYLI